jgi:hypothetical protein
VRLGTPDRGPLRRPAAERHQGLRAVRAGALPEDDHPRRGRPPGVGRDLVKDIQKRDLSRRYARPELKHLRRIAIDEIAVAKGHRYLTLVLDLDSGAVVFVGDGKRADALKPFWRRLRPSGANIEAVAMDMSAAYRGAISALSGILGPWSSLKQEPIVMLAAVGRLRLPWLIAAGRHLEDTSRESNRLTASRRSPVRWRRSRSRWGGSAGRSTAQGSRTPGGPMVWLEAERQLASAMVGFENRIVGLTVRRALLHACFGVNRFSRSTLPAILWARL